MARKMPMMMIGRRKDMAWCLVDAIVANVEDRERVEWFMIR